jgi:hypothetical protein
VTDPIHCPEQSNPVDSPIYRQFFYDLAQRINELDSSTQTVVEQANNAFLFNVFPLTNTAASTNFSGIDIDPNNIFLPDDDGAVPIVGTLNWSDSRNPLSAVAMQVSHDVNLRTLSFNELIPGGAGSATVQIIGGTRGTFKITTTTSSVQLIASAQLLIISNSAAITYDGSKFARASTDPCKLGSGDNGWTNFYLDYTNTATIGAVTINKPSGRVNIAAAGTNVVVTNSLVTAKTHCFCNLNGAPDATAFHAQANTATPGQITITLNAACTAGVAIDFFLVSAD